MANEQTTVPLFVAAEVLTAADMNISAGTGVPVFSNSTTRDAGFGGAGEKVLAEGQLCYLSDSNIVQYYSGASWATVGPATASALTLVSATTIGTTVASVTVSGAFSSTYENYQITVTGGVSSATTNLGLNLGSTTTGYYAAYARATYAGAADNAGDSNQAQWSRAGTCDSNTLISHLFLLSPNLAKKTTLQGWYSEATTGGSAGAISGFLNDSTQYTAFTITPATGTLTGGTIRVYGYSNS